MKNIEEAKPPERVDEYGDKPPSKEEVNTQTCIRQSCAGRVSSWVGGSLFSWLGEVFTLRYASSSEPHYRVHNFVSLLDFDG